MSFVEDEKEQEHQNCPLQLAVLSRPWEWERAEAEAEAQGMKTPPLIAPLSISIPFKWEETPGKPIQPLTLTLTPSRSLHLPPKLLAGTGHGVESPSKRFSFSSLKTRSSSLRLDFGFSSTLPNPSPTSILNSPTHSPTPATPTTTASSASSTSSLHEEDHSSVPPLTNPNSQHKDKESPTLRSSASASARHQGMPPLHSSTNSASLRSKGIFMKMKRSSTFFATIFNRMRSRIWVKKRKIARQKMEREEHEAY